LDHGTDERLPRDVANVHCLLFAEMIDRCLALDPIGKTYQRSDDYELRHLGCSLGARPFGRIPQWKTLTSERRLAVWRSNASSFMSRLMILAYQSRRSASMRGPTRSPSPARVTADELLAMIAVDEAVTRIRIPLGTPGKSFFCRHGQPSLKPFFRLVTVIGKKAATNSDGLISHTAVREQCRRADESVRA
jgi:hypothetical protein